MLGGAAQGLAEHSLAWHGPRTGASEGVDPERPQRPSAVGGWLSLDEKAALTGGDDLWHTVAVHRLGIPALQLTDGPSGARGTRFGGDTSVCLPCATALASTWDRDLVRRVGGVLADQAREKGAQVLLAPTVNLHRHPLAGRNFEAFSEDPYLTAQLASAYVRGVQERGVGCTVKHFVAHEQEHERMEVSAEVDERTLRELYLLPFEAVVRSEGVWALMTAYNRLHGVHCSEHAGLLQGILRDEWGFDGLVMSDWFGTHSTVALQAGLDLEMPGPPRFLGRYVAAAVRQGDVDEAALDRSARRLLRLVDRLAAWDPGDVPAGETPEELARDAARQAIVVLRNEGVLPLAPDGPADPAGRAARVARAARAARPTIAVLGPKADRPDVQGRGSSHVDPAYVVTPLEGIRRRAGDGFTVVYEPGVAQQVSATLDGHELRVPGTDEPGVVVEYFAGRRIEGAPIHREVLSETRLFWLGPPVPGLPTTQPGQPGTDVFSFSVRARADVVVDRAGPWRFGLTSAGRSRVLLDGRVLLDNLDPVRGTSFFGRGSTEVVAEAELLDGTRHELVAELHVVAESPGWLSGLHLTAQPPVDPEALVRAVDTASDADVAVVVVGNTVADSEGSDRRSLQLPDDQTALVQAVAAANPSTVVVVDTAGPVTMDWVDDVSAVAQLWYLGQETGTALAQVLFGDVDPGGRLPTSFPRRLEDTPAYPWFPGSDGRTRYGEGLYVGYRHYDARGVEPLFCFGHGLSYTRFVYGELQVDDLMLGAVGACPDRLDDPVVVRVHLDVTNVGDRPGSDVVQLYVRDVLSSVTRPEHELKQFAKVHLDPGATQTVQLDLPRRAFAFWDVSRHGWTVEPGDFELRVGSSSRAIHRTATLRLA